MKYFIYVGVCFCLLFIFSCGAGVNSGSEELSHDSYFMESGHDMRYITSHNNLHKTILPRVAEYAHNDQFIIAVQLPSFKYQRAIIASELNTGVEEFDSLLQSADSILLNDPYYKKILSRKVNLWIIRNETHELFGPLTVDEYLKKRTELNIPAELKLDYQF